MPESSAQVWRRPRPDGNETCCWGEGPMEVAQVWALGIPQEEPVYSAVEACNGAEALTHFRRVIRTAIALLLTDVVMPAMTASSFGRASHEGPGLPLEVLYISGKRRMSSRSPVECWTPETRIFGQAVLRPGRSPPAKVRPESPGFW